MEDALAKIRLHTSSSLLHQKTPATLLLAIESTLKEQNTEPTPTAYFAALLTALDGTLQRKDTSLADGAILPAELYLLALVAPFIPKVVLRTHLNTLLSFTSPLFPLLIPHAPPIRSQLSLYHVIFQSLDRSKLETPNIRQTFASILNLCLDPRPKVRKKAADLVKDMLCNPPSPLLLHPYAEMAAEWIKAALVESNSTPFSRGKSRQNTGGPESAIYVLTLLGPILPNLPSVSLPEVTVQLLNLPRLGNPYLSQSCYSILSGLFSLPDNDDGIKFGDQLPQVLQAVLSSPPTKVDTIISPAWIQVLGDVMRAYMIADAGAYVEEFDQVWKAAWNFLDSSDSKVRKASARSLSILVSCFSPSLGTTTVALPRESSIISKIISQIIKALENVAYARSAPELLAITSSLITGLRRKGSRTTSEATEALLPLVSKVGELRAHKNFEFKEAADSTLGVAMQILGPEVLLRVLPLNLEPEQRKAGKEPRAYLLPLLSQPHASPLGHFVSYFIPLSEKMFDFQQVAESEGRQSEAKMWSVLVGQIWAGLTGYCCAPVDLKEALSPGFAQLLSRLLYSETELRPAILKALKVLVESNQLSTDDTQTPMIKDISFEERASNIAFLKTQAESWLAVLFNVFGSVNRDSKSMVSDVIDLWASIADQSVITTAYQRVIDLFETNLANEPNTTANTNSEIGSTAAMAQDILILLLPYLPRNDAQTLFDLCLTPQVLSGKDSGVQKRGYKILTKLIDKDKVETDILIVLEKLDKLLEGLTPAAKKDRFNFLSVLIPHLPSSALHMISTIIPEVVLGTKEPSDKARGAAFEVILAMGRKMSAGGIVKRNLMEGMDEDKGGEVAANIEEYMTMLAGGLAGASPHMISATVTAISRSVFEFKDVISAKMLNEIIQTLLVFLTSANREIVKSVLGFVKLSIHTFSTELIRPHLNELVSALLRWSHDHKNHFKVKVRHIFERMLRRFSWEEVYTCAGNDEAGKVLLNIKKRKDRAKKKKSAREEGEDQVQPSDRKPAIGSGFEDVLYGSESELEDTDDEDVSTAPNELGKKNVEYGARLRLDDDEPMDLLQGAAGHVHSAKSNRRRQPGQEAAHFKTDMDTGKMIIDDSDDSEKDAAEHGNKGDEDIAGKAYRENMTSADGFTRGQGGRLKFNKDTKKRRREDVEMDEDVEMADGEKTSAGRKKKQDKKKELGFGHEFKAKRAGGDIKKQGMDPYAYLSLQDAARRTKGRKRIGITSRR